MIFISKNNISIVQKSKQKNVSEPRDSEFLVFIVKKSETNLYVFTSSYQLILSKQFVPQHNGKSDSHYIYLMTSSFEYYFLKQFVLHHNGKSDSHNKNFKLYTQFHLTTPSDNYPITSPTSPPDMKNKEKNENPKKNLKN